MRKLNVYEPAGQIQPRDPVRFALAKLENNPKFHIFRAFSVAFSLPCAILPGAAAQNFHDRELPEPIFVDLVVNGFSAPLVFRPRSETSPRIPPEDSDIASGGVDRRFVDSTVQDTAGQASEGTRQEGTTLVTMMIEAETRASHADTLEAQVSSPISNSAHSLFHQASASSR